MKMRAFAPPWIAIISISWLLLVLKKDITPSIPLPQSFLLVGHREPGSHRRVDRVGMRLSN